MAAFTVKQRRFVEEYIVDFNGYQAALRAGYSPRSASVQAIENLGKPNIAKAVGEEIAKRSKATGIDAAYVLRQAVKLHERCMVKGRGFMPSAAAKALELVGKHVGVKAFGEQQTIVPIQLNFGPNDDKL